MIHGGPAAPGSAAGLARGLSSDFFVLEPFQRSSGTVPLTVAQHVNDLASIAPEPCAIVGHSWGAMLGLSFTARYPNRVTRLTLVGCGTYNEECRAIYRERSKVLPEWFDRIDDAADDDSDSIPFDSAGHFETWEDELRLQREGQEPQSFTSISCPVLMLHGDIDPHPGPEMYAFLRHFIPQLEYVEFADCGHDPWRERRAREAFFKTLGEWLKASLI